MENHELLESVGIPLDLTISLENWTAHLAYALVGWQNVSWHLADVLNHPIADSDQGMQIIGEFLNYPRFANLKEQTLLNIKSVGKKFPPEVRKAGVPFTYYQEAQALPLPDALEAIEKADNAKDIREAVRATKNGSAGARSAATVITEDVDEAEIRARLISKARDFNDVVYDFEMNLDQIRIAAKPLYQALKDLLR